MNKENLDFLKDRLYFLGFGDSLSNKLEKKIEQGSEKFNLTFPGEFERNGTKNVVDYSIEFSKSKQNDMYFINNYSATLKNDDPEKERSQKFYLNNGSGVTAKEAYNMLEGRAAFKNNLVNRDNEKYSAWLQINFNEKDDKGNHKIQQYHEAWRYDLERSLNKHPIKELGNETQKGDLIRSLEKGNIQQVTFVKDGREEKMYLEANPKDRNVIVYDENMKKQFQGIRQHKPETKEDNTQAHAQGQFPEAGGRGAEKDKKESTSQNTDSALKQPPASEAMKAKEQDSKHSERLNESEQSERKSKKKGVSI